MPRPYQSGKTVAVNVYGMERQLQIEALFNPLVQLLFLGHDFKDISSSLVERKSGSDFTFRPRNDDGTFGSWIRGENKFEQYVTGRITLEFVSVDRGQEIVAGWFFTSRAAWLLSWFLSGELIAVPMDDLRDLVLRDPLRNRTTTTARNKRYLSWCVLENINYVLTAIPNARWIDLAHLTGGAYAEQRMVRGAALQKRCSEDELVDLMRSLPGESRPRPVSQEQLKAYMQSMAPFNLKQEEHAWELRRLPFLLSNPTAGAHHQNR